MDNVVDGRNEGTVYFTQYHPVSKWRTNNYFTICNWSVNDKIVLVSENEFEMAFLKQGIQPDELIVHRSFDRCLKDNSEVLKLQNLRFK